MTSRVRFYSMILATGLTLACPFSADAAGLTACPLAVEGVSLESFRTLKLQTENFSIEPAKRGDINDIMALRLNPQVVAKDNIRPSEDDDKSEFLVRMKRNSDGFIKVVRDGNTKKIVGVFTGFYDFEKQDFPAKNELVGHFDLYLSPEHTQSTYLEVVGALIPEMQNVKGIKHPNGPLYIDTLTSETNPELQTALRHFAFKIPVYQKAFDVAKEYGLDPATPKPIYLATRMTDVFEGMKTEREAYIRAYDQVITPGQNQLLEKPIDPSPIYKQDLTSKETAKKLMLAWLAARAKPLEDFDYRIASRVKRIDPERRSAAPGMMSFDNGIYGSYAIDYDGSPNFRIDVPEEFKDTEIPFLLMAHEAEHYIQEMVVRKLRDDSRNSDQYLELVGIHSEFAIGRFLQEKGAMRSEFSFISSIPSERRKQLIELVKATKGMDEIDRRNLVRRLDVDGLTADQYVEREHATNRYSVQQVNSLGFKGVVQEN
jgi:hypothetical protein